MADIFISIASYRDPQTIPTILDAYNKAKNPDSLRFGICLQHEPNEVDLKALKHIKSLDILEYDWRESQGTCWARHSIQKLLYNKEKYYFQLDSHHRFCEHWDVKLIRLLENLRPKHPKPIIGGYCPGFKPDSTDDLEDKPMKICSFSDFTDLGDLMFIPKVIKSYEDYREKKIGAISARFLSGHFIFSDGVFCDECLYDPNLYFRGEELSLSARAYTNGYDFFHPTDCVVWHEYIRENQIKHWNDHTKDNGFIKTSEERSNKAKQRVRQLLNMENSNINFGKYGLGNKRSIHDYEKYAGLCLSTRKIHKYAYNINDNAPNPYLMTEEEWSSGLMEKYKVEFDFPVGYLQTIKSSKDFGSLAIIFESKDNMICHRKDIKRNELSKIPSDKFTIIASMEFKPVRISLCPFVINSTKVINKTIIRSIKVNE